MSVEDAESLTAAILVAIEENSDEDGHASIGDVVDTVRAVRPDQAEDVHSRLEELEKHGQIYPVGSEIAVTDQDPLVTDGGAVEHASVGSRIDNVRKQFDLALEESEGPTESSELLLTAATAALWVSHRTGSDPTVRVQNGLATIIVDVDDGSDPAAIRSRFTTMVRPDKLQVVSHGDGFRARLLFGDVRSGGGEE